MENLQELGYLGLFLGSFLASTLMPFSADALLVASFSLGGNVVLSLGIATIGNWLGSIATYWVGSIGNWKFIEKYLKIKREKLEKQQAIVKKYGSWLALFTWLPFIGDLFALTLGFYKVNFYCSAIFMLIGKFLRFLFWAVLFLNFKDTLGL